MSLPFLVDFPKPPSRLPVRCLTLEIFLIFFHVINLQQMQESVSFPTREKNVSSCLKQKKSYFQKAVVSFEFAAFSALSVKSLLKKKWNNISMERIIEYDHFSKMTEEKFFLPCPFLTLAQIQTFHQSIHSRKKTGTREHLPVSLLTSIQHLP